MILHIDMDAFYASVEERDNPELRGHPVVVGGTPQGRGVVAAANYLARSFGVRSAMSAAQAKRRCPDAIFISPRMPHYVSASREINAIFERYTPLIEPLSLDEAFLDVTGSYRLFGSPVDIGRRIKADIATELELVASVGVAPNKFLAKVASAQDKPDGFKVVASDQVQAFLDPLPVAKLWGVGKVGQLTLERLGVTTIADLRGVSDDLLTSHFGKWGAQLSLLARGIDNRRVITERDAKSISHETTFERDITSRDVLRAWLMDLTEQVAIRLRRQKLLGSTVFIKLRYADFRTTTRSRQLSAPSDVTQEIWRQALDLLEQQIRRCADPVRLIGVGVASLAEQIHQQADLFAQRDRDQKRKLDRVSDEIRRRYGDQALRRGTGLNRKQPD